MYDVASRMETARKVWLHVFKGLMEAIQVFECIQLLKVMDHILYIRACSKPNLLWEFNVVHALVTKLLLKKSFKGIGLF